MMGELPQVIEPCVKCKDRESPSEKKSAHSEGPLEHVKARSGTGYRVVDQFPYAIGHPSVHTCPGVSPCPTSRERDPRRWSRRLGCATQNTGRR